jgi:DNA-directed RNA polymerase subunit RPC12/RpoP
MQTIKEEVIKLMCDRCGNTWQPRVDLPVKCPRCGHRFDSTRINKTKKTNVTPRQEKHVSQQSPAPDTILETTVID